MAPWFHSLVLATTLVATVAVGVASASLLIGSDQAAAPKADRLPIVADSSRYVTVETRGGNVSTLHKVQID